MTSSTSTRTGSICIAVALLAPLVGLAAPSHHDESSPKSYVTVVGAYSYSHDQQLKTLERGRQLVGTELLFSSVPDGLDLDDVEMIDAASGETLESGPDIAFLDANGKFASWRVAPDPKRLHVLLMWDVPDSVHTIKLSYWGELLTPTPRQLVEGGPAVPKPGP